MAENVIDIDVTEVRDRMRKAGEIFDQETFLEVIGMRALAWINENFETDGGKVGGWQPLSENTVAQRRKGSSKPLQDTGNLRGSFEYEVSGNQVKVGTSVEYAKFHEFGTDPYTIDMGNTGVMAFMTTGGVVVVRSVDHPGIPQRRILPNDREGMELAMLIVKAKLEQLRAA